MTDLDREYLLDLLSQVSEIEEISDKDYHNTPLGKAYELEKMTNNDDDKFFTVITL